MKELNRIHLNGLRALEAVGRLGTLQAAADELGVSAGAVSQHVLKAEAQLGKAIFDRAGRNLLPTPFGQTFLTRLNQGFQILEDAVSSASSHDEAILTLSVAPVFASKWLVPRLGDWSRAHPDILVRLDASVKLINPDTYDVDIAIRVGDGQWPDVKTDFLLPQEVFPVCTPVLAAKLKEPSDLFSLPIVRDDNSTLSWNLWLEQFKLDESKLANGSSFTDSALCLDAAIAGQGVMLAWHTLAHDALAAGKLVAPFPQRAGTGLGYYLVTSAKKRDTSTIKKFRRWIKQAIENDFDLTS